MYKCPICGYISDKDYDVCPACNNGNHTSYSNKIEEDYIDLGLPSGTKWAKCNVGADKPEEYGEYYSFDDVLKIGTKVPTKEQWKELINECTWTWTTHNGVNGRLVTGPNGNSIFLPAAGRRIDSSLEYAGSYGHYWSSSLYLDTPYRAWHVFFYDYVDWYYRDRYNGFSVRPVCP